MSGCARQLMLALYRSGRQVESLAVYRDARETLVHELGLEPGRSLQELEQAILSQDPQLGPSARRLPRPRAPRRAALLIGLGGLLLACAAVAAGIVALTAGGGGDHVKALGSGVAAIDPGTGRVASLTETAHGPQQRRRRRGGRLGAEHRGQDHLAHRPEDQEGRQAV